MIQPIASSRQVNRRISEMATIIIQRYQAQDPLFVCSLRGGAPFASKLLFAVAAIAPEFNPELDYITVKTYGSRLSSQPPKLIMELAPDTRAKDRTVVVLDDVLDEGHSAVFICNYLQKRGAAHVDLVVLVQKKKLRPAYPTASLFGFEAPDQWIVGMGMDDPRQTKEGYRWADHIDFIAED